MSALRPIVDLGLTPAEERIAAEVVTGAMNKQIARRLHMADQTVKWHLTRLFRKIGARNRTHAVAILYRAGR